MAVITVDRAAHRYFQIRGIQRAIEACDESMAKLKKEADDLRERMSELRASKTALQADMRAAAKDQGDLPLLDLIEEMAGNDSMAVTA